MVQLALVFVEDLCNRLLIQEALNLLPLQLFDLSFLLGRLDVRVHLLLELIFVVFLDFLLFILSQNHCVPSLVGLLEARLDLLFLFGKKIFANLFFGLSFVLLLPRLLHFLFLQVLELFSFHLGHLLPFNSLSRLELLPVQPIQLLLFLLLDPILDLLIIFQRHLPATKIGVLQLFLQPRIPLLSLHFLLHRLLRRHLRLQSSLGLRLVDQLSWLSVRPRWQMCVSFFHRLQHFLEDLGHLLVVRPARQIVLRDLQLQRQVDLRHDLQLQSPLLRGRHLGEGCPLLLVLIDLPLYLLHVPQGLCRRLLDLRDRRFHLVRHLEVHQRLEEVHAEGLEHDLVHELGRYDLLLGREHPDGIWHLVPVHWDLSLHLPEALWYWI